MLNPALEPLWLSIAVIAMGLLVWGGWRQFRADRTKAILMWVCALVILGNLLILRA
ncbi:MULTISPECIES: hypothetical protein [unclassified Sphingomonas]|jgi:hypothetical protein|uniref:hypothetical protein n=1 Tax=unclassified Sphingomonas TaxID=196159 RepID=UPI0022B3506F|nr:hypothetical protein [Sphingomonas sp. NIBR02145]WHU03333.1 hypothetical protein O3305_01615 [Sphingomonas sp. NIBR02145]